MFQIDKPLPAVTEDGAPYWAAAREGRLELQRCAKCKHWRFPPSVVCPKCLAFEHEWAPVSGRATIYSFIVVHRPQHPGFAKDAPYNVALIELEEGPRMLTNIVDCDLDTLAVGQKVQLVLQDTGKGAALPRFRPAT